MIKKFAVLLSLLFFATSNIRAESQDQFVKCGTPDVLMQLMSGAAKKAFGRPTIGTTMGTSVLSSDGHFRVHYDTTGYNKPNMTDTGKNGIPDYVDSALVYLEYAWNLEVNQLGFDPPLPDKSAGGGDEVDVYIMNFGPGGYGVTVPELSQNGSASAFIEIDNDYSEKQYATKGYGALKVTTAHEFFHTIHFRYKYGYQLTWWMEQSSVWMEERAWDDVNDYLAYLHHYFGGEIGDSTYPCYYKVTSLDENTGSFMYGAAIWAMFLAKRYGDDQIRIIWETLRDSSYPCIADFDGAIKKRTSGDAGLSDALGEFAIWNYFTRERANTVDFYHDSDLFNVAVVSDRFWNFSPASDSLNMKNLTSRYIELLFVGSWNQNDILKVDVIPRNHGSFSSSVVLYNNPYNYEIHKVTQEDKSIALSKHWDRGVLIISCTNPFSETYLCFFGAEMVPSTGVENQPLYAFDLHGAYPNPFNPSTTISFTLPRPEQVTIRVFNSSGQKVDDLFEGYLTAGEKHVLWKPSGCAAGVYFVTVTTPSISKTVKILMMK